MNWGRVSEEQIIGVLWDIERGKAITPMYTVRFGLTLPFQQFEL
jgi:hypothetical protein